MNREQQRHEQQLAFIASGQELEVGRAQTCPIAPEILATTSGNEAFVLEDLKGGLTAHVYKIRAAGRDWTLKKARDKCLVQNVDGQTSFLNEVQRRADIQRLKDNPATADRVSAVVDTQYASYKRGIILSPWIEGEPVRDWNERRLTELFDTVSELLLAGLFEWDLCGGNILDDGHIRLFDFGYMYRFDPLRDFNSNGLEAPLFHGAERFETRLYFAYLLDLEALTGQDKALQAFRLEKQIALHAYERLIAELKARHATGEVLDWLSAIVQAWRNGLTFDLGSLYLSEGWRSHRLDLDDDLRGQTCTPLTLRRIDWLENALRRHERELRALDAFFWDDKQRSTAELLHDLGEARVKATRWQIGQHKPSPSLV